MRQNLSKIFKTVVVLMIFVAFYKEKMKLLRGAITMTAKRWTETCETWVRDQWPVL
jgi:hypothetical protein